MRVKHTQEIQTRHLSMAQEGNMGPPMARQETARDTLGPIEGRELDSQTLEPQEDKDLVMDSL